MEPAVLNGSSTATGPSRAADESQGTESTVDRLLVEVGPLEEELHRVEETIAELSATARSLRLAIAGINGLRDPALRPTVEREADAPAGFHGLRAVRKVMESEPDRLWSASQVFKELTERGWFSPNSVDPRRQVNNRLHDLLRRGEIQRVDRGVYQYVGTARGLQRTECP